MIRVTFSLYLKGDIDNWWSACNPSNYAPNYGMDWKMGIKPSLRRRIAGVPYKKAVKFLKPYLKNLYKQRKNNIKESVGICSAYWSDNEKEIFARLRKITKRPIWPAKINCFYTTFPRCPYGYSKNHAWLYINQSSFDKKKVCVSIMLHEIMHFQFHRYFWGYCKKRGLNDKQTNHLKEATTFLINEEFSDLGLHDKGYPIHKKLRAELKAIWKKEKNFRKIMDSGVLLIKNKYMDLP